MISIEFALHPWGGIWAANSFTPHLCLGFLSITWWRPSVSEVMTSLLNEIDRLDGVLQIKHRTMLSQSDLIAQLFGVIHENERRNYRAN